MPPERSPKFNKTQYHRYSFIKVRRVPCFRQSLQDDSNHAYNSESNYQANDTPANTQGVTACTVGLPTTTQNISLSASNFQITNQDASVLQEGNKAISCDTEIDIEAFINSQSDEDMSTPTCFPPIKNHGLRQISQNEAQSLLASFLKDTATKPHLQPNARLTEGGPISINSDASQSLTLHNLHRVNAGLRGENLGADPSLQKYGREGTSAFQKQVGNEHGGAEDESMGVTGWQDKAEFEREQGEEVGEIGSRGPSDSSRKVMVEQRKKDKKARRKEEKKAKNQR